MTESQYISVPPPLTRVDGLVIEKRIPLSVNITSKRGLLKIKHVGNKTGKQVSEAMIELLMPIKQQVKTMISDNGKDFADYKKVMQKLFSPFFFAVAYVSWQTDVNKSTNGLIREFLHKGYDFRQISD